MGDALAQDWGDGTAYPAPFGQYELLRPFARGGMGEVFIARSGEPGFEKYCVLKKLRPELTKDREYVTRFIDEARVVVQLHHAKIAQVFDVGRVGAEYFLAMEYVAGRDVRSLDDKAKERGGPLPTGTVLFIITEILEALDYAHRRPHPETGELLNLVHRDVSPQNVLISFNGEVKLIDFGLAQSSMKVERTQPNIVMGKMAYMAPEHARGDPIDARADLFAVGVMAYELLAGERYYEGKEAHEIWQVVGRGGYRPGKWKTLPKDIRKILEKALASESEKRFATCGDFQEALLDIAGGQYPDANPAALRAVVHDHFKEAIENEQNMVRSFESVPAIAHDEESRSQSVSLARYDTDEGFTLAPDASADGFAIGEKTEAEWGGAPPSTKRSDEGTEQDLTALASSAPSTIVVDPSDIEPNDLRPEPTDPVVVEKTNAYVRTPTKITSTRRPALLLLFPIFILLGVMGWLLLSSPSAETLIASIDEKVREESPIGEKANVTKGDVPPDDATKETEPSDNAVNDTEPKEDAGDENEFIQSAKTDEPAAKDNDPAAKDNDPAAKDNDPAVNVDEPAAIEPKGGATTVNAAATQRQKEVKASETKRLIARRQSKLKRAAAQKKKMAEQIAAEKERLQKSKTKAPVSQAKKFRFIKKYRNEPCSKGVFLKAHTKANDPKGYGKLVDACYQKLKRTH